MLRSYKGLSQPCGPLVCFSFLFIPKPIPIGDTLQRVKKQVTMIRRIVTKIKQEDILASSPLLKSST